ncbi:urea amidolyase family protein [Microbacterium sp. USHLN186]|uniref:5-oxoprolinase subunit B/C family protein n=1 Tax=Microbacterium sp. USHLN186 TaxID=3081286 RepID=UPI003016F3D6
MHIRTASDRALLVEAAGLDEAMSLHRAWTGMTGVVELVPAARTVLVHFDPLVISAADLAALLAATVPDAAASGAAGEVTIAVRYDGADLAEVAGLLGVSVEEVVRRHVAAHWTVAFTGFAPGFGYLVGDDPLCDVPRRASPRTRVPAGSVGLAGRFTGAYPRESPGGWQLIGTTDARLWDVHREPPALLVPGTRVRFVAAPHTAPAAPPRQPTSSAAAPAATSARRLEVLRPGLQLLVQDRGRPGLAHLGVSPSGAADRTAMRDANRAVGNDRHAAVLECIPPVALRVHGEGVVAVTGAVAEILVTGDAGQSRAIPHGIPFAVADGDVIELGPPVRGVRCVIGVRGGIRAPVELGSRATDTLSGLGPAPLAAGDVVEIGADAAHAVEPQPLPRALPASGDLVVLDVTLGPRDDWFTAAALRALSDQEWTVTTRSDRVGIRLLGKTALERCVAGELPSEGAVTGALQVPPDGQPVLFLSDHPLTGGYPVIAAVVDACLDEAAQLPPGTRVRFRVVDPAG